MNTETHIAIMPTDQKSPSCDFGRYLEIWEDHQKNCKRIVRITNNYIVIITKDNSIDWETTESYDKSNSDCANVEREKTLSLCAIAENKPTGGLSEESIVGFKTIIGEAIVNCLENNFPSATEILAQADEFRRDRLIEKSREWYLTYTLAISALITSLVVAINSGFVSIWEPSVAYLNAGTWAIAGACLSIIQRSGSIKSASLSGKRLHILESISHLISGFISGQLVYLGIGSGLIFSLVSGTNSTPYALPFLALIAGASERLVPSIITKIEVSSTTQESRKED